MASKIGLFIVGLLTGGLAQASLILNGGFESGVLGAWNATGTIGVAGTSGSNYYPGTFYYGAGSAAQDGNFAISFNSGDATPNGVLWQTFGTVAGQNYTVNYDFGPTYGGHQSIQVQALGTNGSTVLGSQTPDVSASGAQLLQHFTFSFTADGSQATLRFSDILGNPTFSQDGVLDNVSVTGLAPAVPEPAPLALLALSLSGLFLQRRGGNV